MRNLLDRNWNIQLKSSDVEILKPDFKPIQFSTLFLVPGWICIKCDKTVAFGNHEVKLSKETGSRKILSGNKEIQVNYEHFLLAWGNDQAILRIGNSYPSHETERNVHYYVKNQELLNNFFNNEWKICRIPWGGVKVPADMAPVNVFLGGIKDSPGGRSFQESDEVPIVIKDRNKEIAFAGTTSCELDMESLELKVNVKKNKVLDYFLKEIDNISIITEGSETLKEEKGKKALYSMILELNDGTEIKFSPLKEGGGWKFSDGRFCIGPDSRVQFQKVLFKVFETKKVDKAGEIKKSLILLAELEKILNQTNSISIEQLQKTTSHSSNDLIGLLYELVGSGKIDGTLKNGVFTLNSDSKQFMLSLAEQFQKWDESKEKKPAKKV